MKTVIFIIALTVMVVPVVAAVGDAIACPSNTPWNPCNMCIEGANGAATNECYDCKAGYQLVTYTQAQGWCIKCPAGTSTFGGTAVSGYLAINRPSFGNQQCYSCDPSCAECQRSSPDGCTRCAAGRFATASSATGFTCGGTCLPGTTRDVSSYDLTTLETQSAVCTIRCHSSCAECTANASIGVCSRCAPGHYLSAKDTEPFGICSRCTGGLGKNRDKRPLYASDEATSNSAACTTICTASSRCDSCSASRPDECLSCTTGFSLEPSTRTCRRDPVSAFTALMRMCFGVSVAAYVLF